MKAWCAAVHGVTKSWTQLSNSTTTINVCEYCLCHHHHHHVTTITSPSFSSSLLLSFSTFFMYITFLPQCMSLTLSSEPQKSTVVFWSWGSLRRGSQMCFFLPLNPWITFCCVCVCACAPSSFNFLNSTLTHLLNKHLWRASIGASLLEHRSPKLLPILKIK